MAERNTDTAGRTAQQSPASRPSIKRTIEIRNEDVKRLLNQQLTMTLRSLYRIDNVIPKITKVEHAQQVRDQAADYINECLQRIDTQAQQLQKIVDDDGLDDAEIEYTNSEKFQIHISSPTSARLVQLFTRLDDVLSLVESLWIQAALDMQQHVNAPRQLTRLVLHTTRQITSLQNRVEKAARDSKESQHSAAQDEKEGKQQIKEAAKKDNEEKEQSQQAEHERKDDESTTKAGATEKATKAKKPVKKNAAKADASAPEPAPTEITAEDVESSPTS